MNKLLRFVQDESGVTAIEYGLIAAATGLVLVATMPVLKGALQGVFQDINDGLTGSTGGSTPAGSTPAGSTPAP